MVKDLNLPVEIAALPTVREYDGLALSSRNSYLTPEERKKAAMLYQTLTLAQDEIKQGERDARKIVSRAQSLLFSEPSIRLDYLQLVDPQSLEEVKKVKGRVVIALAASIGKTRLIDNLTINAD
jgi:pantoate--beta-alanine ligase